MRVLNTPAIAGQLFVDDVGDPVRGRAQLRRRDGVGESRQQRLLDDIEQEKPHFDPAVGQRRHAADDDRVGAARRPVAVAHVFGARRPRIDAARIDELEQAAARKIVAHDLRDAQRIGALVGEGHDGDRNGRRAATHDLDGELRARHACREHEQAGAAGNAVAWGIRVDQSLGWELSSCDDSVVMGACVPIITNARSAHRVKRQVAEPYCIASLWCRRDPARRAAARRRGALRRASGTALRTPGTDPFPRAPSLRRRAAPLGSRYSQQNPARWHCWRTRRAERRSRRAPAATGIGAAGSSLGDGDRAAAAPPRPAAARRLGTMLSTSTCPLPVCAMPMRYAAAYDRSMTRPG